METNISKKYDLEEAANEIAYNMMPVAMITNCEDGHPDYDAWGALREKFIEGFKAGAEWQNEKDQTLIKEAHDFGFGAGSEWQKQQMLKEAREGYITLTLTGQPTIAALLNEKEFTPYDKVKIVIVKED